MAADSISDTLGFISKDQFVDACKRLNWRLNKFKFDTLHTDFEDDGECLIVRRALGGEELEDPHTLDEGELDYLEAVRDNVGNARIMLCAGLILCVGCNLPISWESHCNRTLPYLIRGELSGTSALLLDPQHCEGKRFRY